MTSPRPAQPTADSNAPTKSDPLDMALARAMQPPAPLPLSAGFAKRVARQATQRMARRRQDERTLRIGIGLALLGLFILGMIGWQLFQPKFIGPVLDGPFPLVLTACCCLAAGGHWPKVRQIRI